MSDIKTIQREETSLLKKIFYASPRLGTSIILGVEEWAVFTLYILGYNVPPILTGLALGIGYLTIAASQSLIGWISDRFYTRIGRRKPYIIILAPLLGISYIFILLPGLVIPDLSNAMVLFFWVLIWDIMLRFSYAVTTPYQAWLAELFIVHERPTVSQAQNTFNFIGEGIQVLFTLFLLEPFLEALKGDVNAPIPPTIIFSVIIFGVLTVILFYILAIFMPKEPKYEIKSSMIENVKVILKNKNYLKLILMHGISSFAWAMVTKAMLSYTEQALNLTGTDYYIIAIGLLLGIFVFLTLWRKLVQSRGKKSTLLNVILFGILFLPISLLALIPMSNYLILGIVFILGIAFLLGGWFLFPYIIYADIAEDDEKKTGELKAGLYAGFNSIVLNIFQAIGTIFIGFVFALPDINVGSLSYSLGFILWGPIASIFLIISYFYTKKFITLDFEWEKEV